MVSSMKILKVGVSKVDILKWRNSFDKYKFEPNLKDFFIIFNYFYFDSSTGLYTYFDVNIQWLDRTQNTLGI